MTKTFHEDIFKNLLAYKETHPDFVFIPRQRNTQNKLNDGFWFQGTDKYAFVGLVNSSGGVNKTRSVGLVFYPVGNYLEFSFEIVFKGETDKELILLYHKLRDEIGGFNENESEKFNKYVGETEVDYQGVFDFLDQNYNKIVRVFQGTKYSDLILSEEKFNELILRINSFRKDIAKDINKLLINLTWNSKDWKDVSIDQSNHSWVKEGGTPYESWNFLKEAEGNTHEHIYGYAKFTHQPKIEGKSIFIFYSQDNIVGFYGNGQLKSITRSGHIMNLQGDQSMSFVLKNKIENVFQNGFMENSLRIGQIGFNYLENNESVIKILNEASKINPEQFDEIENLKKWFIENSGYEETTPKYWIFQGNPNIYNVASTLEAGVLTTWKVAAHKESIKIGDKVILWLTGAKAGCYALAQVTSAVGKIGNNPEEIDYYKTVYDPHEDRVNIEIVKNFYGNPILWNDIKDIPVFSDFKGGNQGTNFSATAEEFNYFNQLNQEILQSLIQIYSEHCIKTNWLDNELYKFMWARWLNSRADFDTIGNALLFQLAIDSQNEDFNGQRGVQFLRQGARYDLKRFIGIDDISYFREFKEGKSLTEIGFEDRSMSYPVISCWLASFFPEKIYPVSRTSFAEVVRNLFNANLNNSGIAFIEGLQPYCNQIDNELKKSIAYQNVLKDKLKINQLNQLEFNWAVQDFLLFIDRNPNLLTNPLPIIKKNSNTMNDQPLNQILFGPPGTGKTFNTINEALKIVDPDYYNQYATDREKLNKRFKELLIKDAEENSGQIGFCTFHQSFGYEDFVEGIKPKTTPNQTIVYEIEDGVFKNICRLATMNNSVQKMKKDKKISWNEEQFRKASFYKLSLGDSSNPSDNNIYEFCRDKGYICIGFGQDNDFKGLSESEINAKCKDLQLESTAASQMNYFIHYLKKNNYILISFGNRYIRALGKVIGDYEYWAEPPIRYNHFRKVEWLFVDEMIPINEIYERGLSQKTMYKIDESVLRKEFFVKDGTTIMEVKEEDKNFVLIIDEINRGNVSSIFGELITLIEKDKREGAKEELEVVLPYSKKPFKVPQNVYLIGTMNTADRSVEALDTALRRRFSFKEFPPQSHLIQTEGVSGEHEGIIDGISLVALLDTINNRIEKLIDKDHRIGHSYFLKVDSKEKLKQAFKNEIIPLLEEYFFGDYGKIGLVLGNTFVEKKPNDFTFANFSDYDTDIQSDLKEKAIYRIKDASDWDFVKI